MKAWRLEKLGGRLALENLPVPVPRPGSVLVRIEASTLLSYLKEYVEGKLPRYNPPPSPFTVGTNAIGIVEATGSDVRGLKPGQRVVLSPHFVARENVVDPAQILIGLTALAGGAGMIADWPDGTLAEYALMPVEAAYPVDDLGRAEPAQLESVSRFVVPFGGLLRGRLAAGETLAVNGASGAFGAAAVILGVAMGAARVVAVGRNEAALHAVGSAAGPRVATVALCGDVEADASAIRTAAGGGAHMALDIIGNARDPNASLATLMSLRRGGRFVAMGSLLTDLPVPYMALMFNDWEVIGQFMYPRSAYRRLFDLVGSGQLDLGLIKRKVYPLEALPEAMEAAAAASNLEAVAIRMSPPG